MKLSTRDSWNVNQRKTGIIAIRTSVIELGVFRNSRLSERCTLALRGDDARDARGGVGEDAPLARELHRDDHRRAGIVEQRTDARRQRPDPADERRERDPERRLRYD